MAGDQATLRIQTTGNAEASDRVLKETENKVTRLFRLFEEFTGQQLRREASWHEMQQKALGAIDAEIKQLQLLVLKTNQLEEAQVKETRAAITASMEKARALGATTDQLIKYEQLLTRVTYKAPPAFTQSSRAALSLSRGLASVAQSGALTALSMGSITTAANSLLMTIGVGSPLLAAAAMLGYAFINAFERVRETIRKTKEEAERAAADLRRLAFDADLARTEARAKDLDFALSEARLKFSEAEAALATLQAKRPQTGAPAEEWQMWAHVTAAAEKQVEEATKAVNKALADRAALQPLLLRQTRERGVEEAAERARERERREEEERRRAAERASRQEMKDLARATDDRIKQLIELSKTEQFGALATEALRSMEANFTAQLKQTNLALAEQAVLAQRVREIRGAIGEDTLALPALANDPTTMRGPDGKVDLGLNLDQTMQEVAATLGDIQAQTDEAVGGVRGLFADLAVGIADGMDDALNRAHQALEAFVGAAGEAFDALVLGRGDFVKAMKKMLLAPLLADMKATAVSELVKAASDAAKLDFAGAGRHLLAAGKATAGAALIAQLGGLSDGGGGAGGGGGGGGGGGRGDQMAGAAQAATTLVLKGGPMIDTRNPDHLDALAEALGALSGRRILIQTEY